MNGKEKKEFYLEYIYSLRMDVYRIIKSVIGDANVTEELTQIVLEKAWRSIESVRDKSKAKEWAGKRSREMFCVITFAEKSESRETGLMKIPRRSLR